VVQLIGGAIDRWCMTAAPLAQMQKARSCDPSRACLLVMHESYRES